MVIETVMETDPVYSNDPYHWAAYTIDDAGNCNVIVEVDEQDRVIAGWGMINSDHVQAIALGNVVSDGLFNAIIVVERPKGGTIDVFRRRQITIDPNGIENLTPDTEINVVSRECALVAHTRVNGVDTYVVLRNDYGVRVVHDDADIMQQSVVHTVDGSEYA